MSSPNQNSYTHRTPTKGNLQMKLIISPEKLPFDLYSQLCRSPSVQQSSDLFSYEENISVPSWSQTSSHELFSSQLADEDKENRNPNLPFKSFETIKKNQRKGCHCQKSHCLKKYCDCYKLGQVCGEDCNCIGCENKEITTSHIKSRKLLELTQSGKGKEIRCNCQKSRCLKNYCECHSIGRYCSPACHCVQCDNKDEDQMGLHGKKRKHLQNISEWNPGNILFN